MTITLDLPSELADRAALAARAQGKDLATYVLDNVRSELRNDVLSESETGLLEIINTPVDPAIRRERDRLIALQKRRSLTDAERRELEKLIDSVEMANAARWQAIAALAVMRGASLAELAQDLQIPLP